jgi:hypothetical protein
MRIAIFLAALVASFPLAAQEQERACMVEGHPMFSTSTLPPFLEGCQEGDTIQMEAERGEITAAIIMRFCDFQAQIITDVQRPGDVLEKVLILCRYKPRPVVDGKF